MVVNVVNLNNRISLSTVVLSTYIGMAQVVLYYAHTFEIIMFHFQFQSDPTFHTSDRHKEHVSSHNPYFISSKTSVFKIIVVVVVVQFRQAFLKLRTCQRGYYTGIGNES